MTSVTAILVVFAVLAFTAESKGVTKWCSHSNKYISKYSPGTFAFSTLSAAKTACLSNNDCFGVTYESNSRYTLRRDWVLKTSPTNEVTFIPCGGYFNCATFGLISVHGKYLSAQPSGAVEWNRNSYGSYEQVTFEQFGKESGFLKSTHGKYLAATADSELQWDRSSKGSWEKFTLEQYVGKIALKSIHGKYVSAQSDGSADVDRTTLGSYEWFTVHPQACLNNIECDCEIDIDTSNYDCESVVYHTEEGVVEAYAPERVGYQYIDNEGTSILQSSTFSVTETVIETASFTHTAGASITVGTEFSVGVPLVGGASVSTSVTASYEFSAGTEHTEEKQMTAEYNCVAPAGRTVTCEALLFKYMMTVPYTQTWRHKTLGCSCETQGEFEEVAASQMKLTVNEIDVIVTEGSGGFS